MTRGATPRARDVEQFLRAHMGDAVSGVAELGRGEWSVAFGFSLDGQDRVVRFGAHVEDFEKDRLAARFAGAEPPIPAVIQIGEAFGEYYAISARVHGAFLDHLDQPQLQRALPSFLSALDAMRAADVSSSSGYGMWDRYGRGEWASWQEALLDVGEDRPGDRAWGWRAKLAASPVGAAPFDEAMERLRHAVDVCPNDRYLVHTDLFNRNVFVEDDRIAGVIDWGNAMYGDFVYELAGMTFWWPWYTQWADIDPTAEARRHYAAIGLEVPRFEQRLACYELQVGLQACAYIAFLQRWDDLAWTTRRMQEVMARVG